MAYTISEVCNGCGACVRLCPVDAIQGEKKEIHVVGSLLCIECGACGRVCPVEAVHDGVGRLCARVKKSEWQKPSFDYDTCISCTICIDTCPVGCLDSARIPGSKDPRGYPFMADEKACIGCGFCSLECPVDAIVMKVPALEQAS
jgi:electron transport complex protein RnfB